MKALSVDFAPRRSRRIWWWALATVLMTVAASQGWRAWSIHRAWLAADREVLRLSVLANDRDAASRDGRDLASAEPPYLSDATAVAALVSFPTSRVLAALENARNDGVRLTSLDLQPSEGLARIEVKYLEPRFVTQLTDELNAGEPRPRWSPVALRASASQDEANSASLAGRWLRDAR